MNALESIERMKLPRFTPSTLPSDARPYAGVFVGVEASDGTIVPMFANGTSNWAVVGQGGAGTGDTTTNTGVSVVGEMALFADTTGKVLKRSAGSGVAIIAAGVLSVGAVDLTGAQVSGNLPVTHFNGGTGASATTALFGDGTWKTPAAGSVATDTIWTAAGDIVTGTGSHTAARLAMGTALQVLQVNSGATALQWVTLSGGGNALTTNPLSQFSATSSAQLAGVINDETGSGLLVFNTGPTLSAPTINGVMVAPGAQVNAPTAMGANAIDITLANNTKAFATSATFTFSTPPTVAGQTFGLTVTATTAGILTLPSFISASTQGSARTTIYLPLGAWYLVFKYDGANTYLYGEPGTVSNFTSATNPAVTDDSSKGYNAGSLWINNVLHRLYFCESAGSGAAVWTLAGGGTGDMLLGTAQTVTANKIYADTTLLMANAGTGAFNANLRYSGTLTAARALTLDLLDGARSLQMGGNVAIANAFSTVGAFGLTLTATATTNATLPAGTNNLGYLESPINSQSAPYTLVLTDSSKTIFHPAADTTARIFTIPANASVAFPVGTCIAIDNDAGAGAISIQITTDVLVLVGAAGSTGTRSLGSGGKCVMQKVATARWRIQGSAELV